MLQRIRKAIEKYNAESPSPLQSPRVALFDMDGVLYDSMPLHVRAWKAMCDSAGLHCSPDEFYRYEGSTGASTIDMLFRRQYGHSADADTCRRLYAVKSASFAAMPQPPLMAGAAECIAGVRSMGLTTVLVTGSGQQSILERVGRDFPGAFEGRSVTSADVSHGKPHPEPYLRGMALAQVLPCQTVAVDNAPMGVESAARAGAFTIGVVTGPLRDELLAAAGAHIVVHSMTEVLRAVQAVKQITSAGR